MAIDYLSRIEQQTAEFQQIMFDLVSQNVKLDYNQMLQISEKGMYVIWYNSEIIYIGKTKRRLKSRMNDLRGDYLSHTLISKLVAELLRSSFDLDTTFKLTKKSYTQLINDKAIVVQDFKLLEKQAIKKIQHSFRFQYFNDVDDIRIKNLEHYAIAVCNPKYND